MNALRPVLAVLAICATLCGPSARLHADDATPPLYIVLFRLTVGVDGKLQDFQMAKVIDLLSGSNNAAAVELPQAFIDHAKERVEGERLKPTVVDGKPTSILASFLMEYTCKSPRNKALTIRTRYICNDRQMLALTAITPDSLPAEEAQSFDRLFEAYRFRSTK